MEQEVAGTSTGTRSVNTKEKKKAWYQHLISKKDSPAFSKIWCINFYPLSKFVLYDEQFRIYIARQCYILLSIFSAIFIKFKQIMLKSISQSVNPTLSFIIHFRIRSQSDHVSHQFYFPFEIYRSR